MRCRTTRSPRNAIRRLERGGGRGLRGRLRATAPSTSDAAACCSCRWRLPCVAFGAALLFPIRSLGPRPGKGLDNTPYAGRRDASRHRRRQAGEAPTISLADSVITVWPGGPHRRSRRADAADPHPTRPGVRAPRQAARTGRSTASSPTRSCAPTSAARSGCTRPSRRLLLCPCHQSTFDVLDGARPDLRPGRAIAAAAAAGRRTTRARSSPPATSPVRSGPASGIATGEHDAQPRHAPLMRRTARWLDRPAGRGRVRPRRAEQGVPRSLVVHDRRARPLLLRRAGRSPASTSTFFFDAEHRATSSTTAATSRCGASTMSAAYESALDISFDVRAGLVMRQIHHWAALLFLAVDRRAPRPRVLHRRVPPPARDQLDDRRDAADPGDRQRLRRLLAARRPAVGHGAADHVRRRAVGAGRRHVDRVAAVRRRVPRRTTSSAASTSSTS